VKWSSVPVAKSVTTAPASGRLRRLGAGQPARSTGLAGLRAHLPINTCVPRGGAEIDRLGWNSSPTSSEYETSTNTWDSGLADVLPGVGAVLEPPHNRRVRLARTGDTDLAGRDLRWFPDAHARGIILISAVGNGGGMPSRPDEPAGGESLEGLRALDGPEDHELEFSGPGEENGRDEERLMPDAYLPGGVDHTTAAVGGGSLGLVLLGIAGAFKRRWARRRYKNLDE
jgi:hypothetical protein